jgi:hypothetical protein
MHAIVVGRWFAAVGAAMALPFFPVLALFALVAISSASVILPVVFMHALDQHKQAFLWYAVPSSHAMLTNGMLS